ncbi:hypothetical protein JCM10908_004319 [Rhodotorula pacifica]|uniref:uncharacterized protein n=1 Tax=Rhodotorula pacifica TaxID=1495444 RepID=UPI00316CA2F5
MWDAQAAFNATCSGGLTVGRWCATSHDQCCGLCQNIPITGPGTFISTVLGSLILLGFARTWKTETPYTLGFQLLSADGAIVGLIDRFFETKNRLTLFHYCFVPLTIVSSVPIIVACCTARLPYLHGVNSGEVRVREHARRHPMYHSEATQTSEDTSPILRTQSAPSLGHRKQYNMRSLPSAEGERTLHSASGQEERPPRSQSVASLESLHPEEFPNDSLVRLVLWATTFHLALFSVVFIAVYGFLDEDATAQANCNKVHNLHRWRITSGVTSSLFLVVAWFFLACAWIARRSDCEVKLDGLDVWVAKPQRARHLPLITSLSHSILSWIERGHLKARRGEVRLVRRKRIKRVCRWLIPLSLWVIWFIAYATIYVTAGNSFLMQGTNMWPFEQISAPFGILVPCVLFFRGSMSRIDGFKGKEGHRSVEEVLGGWMGRDGSHDEKAEKRTAQGSSTQSGSGAQVEHDGNLAHQHARGPIGRDFASGSERSRRNRVDNDPPPYDIATAPSHRIPIVIPRLHTRADNDSEDDDLDSLRSSRDSLYDDPSPPRRRSSHRRRVTRR